MSIILRNDHARSKIAFTKVSPVSFEKPARSRGSFAAAGVSGGPGESGAIYSGVDETITGFGSGGNQGAARPAAYLNYILFDRNYNVLDAGWQLAPDVTFTKQRLSFPTKEIDQEGYMFVYLSYDNDSPNWVYFDDFKVTHTKSNVIQYNEYYPFGLQTGESWTRADHSNKFLYNGGSELNTTSGLYETFFRGYDAALGRFNQVDPLAGALMSHSPYNYGLNNPVYFNDPMGDYVEPTFPPEIVGPTMADLFGEGGGSRGFDQIVSETFGGEVIPGYNGHGSFGNVSPGEFIGNALYGGYSGGTWRNGQAHYFTSDEEGFFAGVAYNNYHNSWANTDYGSVGASLVAFGIIRQSGQMPTGDEVQNVLNPSRLNTFASASNSAVGDPWYMWAWKSYAGYLSNTPMFGTMANPFYRAEALYVDGGWSFVGAEGDAGLFFILAGKEIGEVLSFTEIAGGGATDAGLGVEMGRIDFMGNPLQFKSADLYGLRDKVWLSVSPAGELLSVGGAFAWSSTQEGIKVYASSIQLGFGVSPFPFLSGGYNHGKISK